MANHRRKKKAAQKLALQGGREERVIITRFGKAAIVQRASGITIINRNFADDGQMVVEITHTFA